MVKSLVVLAASRSVAALLSLSGSAGPPAHGSPSALLVTHEGPVPSRAAPTS